MFDFLKQSTAVASTSQAATPPRMKDDPRHVAAVRQYNVLTETLSAVMARRREISLIRLAQKRQDPPTASEHIADAMQMAAGGDVAVRMPKEQQELLREDDALAKQEAALQEALRMNPVIQVERVLNGEFSRTLEKEHAALRGQYAAALRLLGELELKERELMSRGADRGYSAELPNLVQWSHMGELDDPHSAISRRLDELGA